MTIVYYKTELTGGGVNALDGINGGVLNDGDFAFIAASGVFYFYFLDEDSAATASIPSIIEPTLNAGDKRWLLQSVGGAAGGVKITATGDITIDSVPYDVIYYIDPNGDNRNIILSGVWTADVLIKIYNNGIDYALLFDSIEPILPGTPAVFGYDETTWRRWQ